MHPSNHPMRSRLSAWRPSASALMKHYVLSSPFASAVSAVRDTVVLLRAAYSEPALLGMLDNDRLAGSLVARLCRAGMTFVDVGAHVGSVVEAVLRQEKNIRVLAIEAMPAKAALLRARYPSISIFAGAAGPCQAEVSFFVHPRLSAYSSLGRPARGEAQDIVEIRVPMAPLDALVTQAVDVLKIDVEGAELGVLQGGSAMIESCRPTIMFESGPAYEDGLGYSKEAIWHWLHQREYGVYVPNRVAHLGASLSCEGFVESHLYPRRTTNYFAIARERREEIRERARALLYD